LQQPLEQFITALRAAEVRISVAEAIEAHEVVATFGYQDKSLLKDALSITVAKSQGEKESFNHTFDLFFARSEFLDDGSSPDMDTAETGVELADMLLANDRQGLAQAMEQAAQAVGAENIRVFTQRSFFARRILDQMGLRELEQMTAGMGQEGGQGQGQGGGQGQGQSSGQGVSKEQATALQEGRTMLLAEARKFMDRQYELYARAAGEELRAEFLEQTRLANIDRRDFARMNRIVRRMAKKLAARYTRRHKRARRGHLDIRRTLRVNMAHDGIPFETVWKTKKIDRPKIVAICDVSGSVAAASQFLLMFLYSLNEVIAELRSFAFSGNLVEISAELEDNEVNAAIPLILDRVGFRSTDYGQALRDLKADFFDAIDRRTTVIILGDARSNDTDPEVAILRQIAERSKRVIWINPEPQSFWGSGDSEMPSYRPFCHVAKSCSTIKDFERIIDDLLRSTTRA